MMEDEEISGGVTAGEGEDVSASQETADASEGSVSVTRSVFGSSASVHSDLAAGSSG